MSNISKGSVAPQWTGRKPTMSPIPAHVAADPNSGVWGFDTELSGYALNAGAGGVIGIGMAADAAAIRVSSLSNGQLLIY